MKFVHNKIFKGLKHRYFLFSEEWYPQGKQNILPGQMTETLVTNLRPWTVYHLRVFAENQLGKSKDGKVLQVRSAKNWPFISTLKFL